MPRTSLRAYQRLAGGNVVLRDVIDLMMGTTTSEEASVALLDLTTSPLEESPSASCDITPSSRRFAPWSCHCARRCFSTATGELWCVDVEEELLLRSVHEVVDVVEITEGHRVTTLTHRRHSMNVLDRLIDDAPLDSATLTDDHRRLAQRALSRRGQRGPPTPRRVDGRTGRPTLQPLSLVARARLDASSATPPCDGPYAIRRSRARCRG